ncbi:MAG: hypothetical protein DRQ14_03590 [Candidatus Latescibacterota bacterium]|nr:MAG: hypothetical protein DRQ14_03590 [Candidatus Latescibacterota bacterium]HDH99765.1 flagellar protein FlaG [Bacillota bacterium]
MRVESVGIPQPSDIPEVSLQVQEGQDGGEMQPRQQKVASPQEKAKSLDLEKIGEELNRCIRMFNTHLAFEIDRPSNRIIIKIINTETEEVIRQIPPEELLRIMHYMDELLGLLVDERV